MKKTILRITVAVVLICLSLLPLTYSMVNIARPKAEGTVNSPMWKKIYFLMAPCVVAWFNPPPPQRC